MTDHLLMHTYKLPPHPENIFITAQFQYAAYYWLNRQNLFLQAETGAFVILYSRSTCWCVCCRLCSRTQPGMWGSCASIPAHSRMCCMHRYRWHNDKSPNWFQFAQGSHLFSNNIRQCDQHAEVCAMSPQSKPSSSSAFAAPRIFRYIYEHHCADMTIWNAAGFNSLLCS